MVELVYRLHLRSSKVVKLVCGLNQNSPRMMELKVGHYYGCSGSDHRIPGVVKLVLGLHHGSPRMVKLKWGFTTRVARRWSP